jgi:H+-transporting ATPase
MPTIPSVQPNADMDKPGSQERTRKPILRFLSYFWGLNAWMIEFAAILCAVFKRWVDFVLILIILIGYAIVRFWNEYQIGNNIAILKKDWLWKTG